MARPACSCLLLALTVLPTSLAGQCETLSGEVREGELWQRAFGDGLLFRLRPTTQAPPNPPGWTIEVRAAPDGEHDFVSVATPPYRFANPRYLDTGYGRTAREAVSWSPRSFRFVTSGERHAALAEVVRFLLWRPPGMTERAYDAAYDSVRDRWESMLADVGRGELRVVRAEVASPDQHPPNGRIERLAFTVTLCPGGEPPRSGQAASPLEEAVRVASAVHDFDGDGRVDTLAVVMLEGRRHDDTTARCGRGEKLEGRFAVEARLAAGERFRQLHRSHRADRAGLRGLLLRQQRDPHRAPIRVGRGGGAVRPDGRSVRRNV